MTERAAAIEALEIEGLSVTEWHDVAGARYATHSHAQREVRIVLDGSMTINVDGTDHELGPGDLLDIAPNTPHSAVVGPRGVHYLAGSNR